MSNNNISIEEQLYKLLDNNDKNNDKKAKEIILQNPSLNINWQNKNYRNYTCLHIACDYNRSEIISLLLTQYPNINPNLQDNIGWTPFHYACYHNSVELVKLLLNDERIDINIKDDNNGDTGLVWAANNGHIAPIEYILASMRHITLIPNAIDEAKKRNDSETVKFLESYQTQPAIITKNLREKLNITGENNLI